MQKTCAKLRRQQSFKTSESHPRFTSLSGRVLKQTYSSIFFCPPEYAYNGFWKIHFSNFMLIDELGGGCWHVLGDGVKIISAKGFFVG